MAGYSGTPLPRKLGVKPGHQVLALGAPATLDLGEPGADVHREPGGGPYDVILLFCPDTATLHSTFPQAKATLVRNGGLWVCWPKRAARIPTDLSDGVVRAYGLGAGLVDNKVAAIDATWSGLRFVYRVADR
ncbi:DUF3052 domain-containing protein [Nonomuraea sp. WAC 01424]|uniref:DUF3052 domain-containing protein n=1 Tax=Nonomuraea sp. WAC 01424 TaxID=2203200 RepID=UPI000F7AFD85|nr:DUF3052 domain-containing protein [Nonomuraea sp. WAC 01424]RSM94879.1 DUF3052 domain-containing protein [Nonomuraea sp. WAC 01424]